LALEVQGCLSESPVPEMKDIQFIAATEEKVVGSNESKAYDHYKRRNNWRKKY
jgi:hypothetical protein